jgi:hypothetical protein
MYSGGVLNEDDHLLDTAYNQDYMKKRIKAINFNHKIYTTHHAEKDSSPLIKKWMEFLHI